MITIYDCEGKGKFCPPVFSRFRKSPLSLSNPDRGFVFACCNLQVQGNFAKLGVSCQRLQIRPKNEAAKITSILTENFQYYSKKRKS